MLSAGPAGIVSILV